MGMLISSLSKSICSACKGNGKHIGLCDKCYGYGKYYGHKCKQCKSTGEKLYPYANCLECCGSGYIYDSYIINSVYYFMYIKR